MKEKTCFFTGHRDIAGGEAAHIKKRLREEIEGLISRDVIYYGAGGALGFDTLAALTVLRMKKQYPQIRLILVLPCREQDKFWPMRKRLVYLRILRRADKIVYISEAYVRGCMQKRNRYLVDHSGCGICYLRKNTGGTAYTVRYAEERGVRMLYL